MPLSGGTTFANLTVLAGGTLDLYNTADQVTNYERLRADWSGNVARLLTSQGGSGASRAMVIGVSGGAGATFQIGAPFARIGIFGASTSNTGPISDLVHATLTASSGTQTGGSVAPTINQSGTAGYTALDINPTETATGSGTKLLQRWAVGGTAVGVVSNGGVFSINGLGVSSVGSFGFLSSTSIGTAGFDVTLNRDAADTLALRRSTNAQTFRVYNTYTDASNYERLNISATATVCSIVAAAAGTGTARPLDFGANSGTQWRITTAGHWIALTDNTYDIGASGATRPRNLYIAGSTVIGAFHTVGTSTVAGLPAAASAARASVFVSDSSVTASGNFGAVVAGGGANVVPVYSDGTNWRIG